MQFPVWRIGWALDMGLTKHLLDVEIIRFGDKVCRITSKCCWWYTVYTRNPNNVNLSAPFTRKSNNELQYLTLNMVWHCVNFPKSLKVVLTERIRVNPIPFAPWPTTLISKESAHSNLYEMYCFWQSLIDIHSDYFQKMGPYVAKSTRVNISYFAEKSLSKE